MDRQQSSKNIQCFLLFVNADKNNPGAGGQFDAGITSQAMKGKGWLNESIALSAREKQTFLQTELRLK